MPKSFVMAVTCFSLIISLLAVVYAGPVPDTWQTKCYDNTAETPCPQNGEPFYGQDANYTINPPSYTKLDANGNDLPDDAIDWVMVRDNVTGLIWEVKQNKDDIQDYTNPNDADNTYTWYDSNPESNGGSMGTPGDGTDTEDFIEALNDANFGGLSDWRLPTIKELAFVFTSGISNFFGSTVYFPNNMGAYNYNARYWSSTTYAHNADAAWFVESTGNVGSGDSPDKSNSYHVRAVRGGHPGSLISLVNNGDGTITDTSTGLMWQQVDGGETDWESAISYCENLNLAGHNDWRLPNQNEMQSLVKYSGYQPAIDSDFFPYTYVFSKYWSSTTHDAMNNVAYHVGFKFGSVEAIAYLNKSGNMYVRALRGGQSRSSGSLIIATPKQGARLNIGYEKMITWDTAGVSGSVRILLSREAGKQGTFEVISDDTPNDGSFTWLVTGQESFNCTLRIEPLNEPEKATTQSLFSICTLNDAWVDIQKLGGPDKYRLILMGQYSDGNFPLEAVFSVSDPSEATISNNILTASQNERVEVYATYGTKTYSRALFVYNTFDAMEVENNNTMDAPNVSNFPMVDGIFYRGYLPGGDVDFFTFTLAADSIIDLGYMSDSKSADMKIEIFDDSGTLMGSSVSTNGHQQVLPLGLPSGTYYLKITSAGDVDQENYYVVTYKILDTMPGKSTIHLNMDETRDEAIYNLEDESVFTFILAEKKTIKLQFSPGSTFAKYHIELLDNSLAVIDQIECLEQSPVTIETTLQAGSYTVRITPVELVDAAHPFSLELTESLNQLEAEPNNTYGQATDFNIEQPMWGRMFDNADEDFFEFTLSTPRYIELAFTCPNSSKNFYISLYKESDQNLIDGISSVNGLDISLHMGLGIGRYYLKVTSDGFDADTINPYQLSINDSIQTNLEIESNNTIKVGNAIEKASPRKGRIFSSGDIDYYGFHLSGLGLFNIAFTTTTDSGDYKISLVDENDQTIDFRDSSNGAACSLDGYQPPGNFYIRIQNNGDIDQYHQYELTLTSDVVIEGIKKIVSVTVTGSDSDMTVNETQTLTATAGYSDTTLEVIAGPVWSSLDPAIATVNSAGQITAVAEGTTTIVATHGGLTGSFDIKVGAPAHIFSQHYGNLIIVAGSGASESDPLTESAQYLADLVYLRFQTRLFRDEDIYYFNPVAEHDIDGDGYDNNIVDDANPTVNAFNQAITGWAVEQNTDGPLFIYLVGHGEIDTFSFPGETLTASELNASANTFQDATGRQVVVIIEACKSGSFTDDLVSQGEDIIMVTSADDQDAYLKLGGRISFSQFFIDKLFGGGSIYEGWVKSKNKLSDMGLPFSLMKPQLAEGISMASNQSWVGGEFVIASIFPGWVLGLVYDFSTGFAIENATVTLDGVGDFVTVPGGYYLCEVPEGTYTISATSEGYDTATYTYIAVSLGESVILNFGLTSTVTDYDNDNVVDANDNCPNHPNPLQEDADADGVGDICDQCAGDDTSGDDDGDGTCNNLDECDSDPAKTEPGICGCGVPDNDLDRDGDGTPDCNDGCPDDPLKIETGFCGCGVADTDSDSDGTPDCNDNCPNDSAKTEPGICGCGVLDVDEDNDGVCTCQGDKCDSDPAKTEPGICGCGVPDTDLDGDKILDCDDAFPNDPIEKGDIDNDNDVDLSDAILILQVAAGLPPTSVVFVEADVSMDEKCGVEEVVYILQKVSGLR